MPVEYITTDGPAFSFIYNRHSMIARRWRRSRRRERPSTRSNNSTEGTLGVFSQ